MNEAIVRNLTDEEALRFSLSVDELKKRLEEQVGLQDEFEVAENEQERLKKVMEDQAYNLREYSGDLDKWVKKVEGASSTLFFLMKNDFVAFLKGLSGNLEQAASDLEADLD